jgi:hypothetical protein
MAVRIIEMLMKKWLTIVVVFIVIGSVSSVLIYKFVYNKPHPDFTKEEVTVRLAANDLYDAYVQDKQVADSLYTGKMMEIYGTYTSLEEEAAEKVIVFVFETSMFGDAGIRCVLLDGQEGDNLQEGAEVQIKGYCSGYNETDVILEKCSIIKDTK